jgi:hypothetical protein
MYVWGMMAVAVGVDAMREMRISHVSNKNETEKLVFAISSLSLSASPSPSLCLPVYHRSRHFTPPVDNRRMAPTLPISTRWKRVDRPRVFVFF